MAAYPVFKQDHVEFRVKTHMYWTSKPGINRFICTGFCANEGKEDEHRKDV